MTSEHACGGHFGARLASDEWTGRVAREIPRRAIKGARSRDDASCEVVIEQTPIRRQCPSGFGRVRGDRAAGAGEGHSGERPPASAGTLEQYFYLYRITI